MKRHVLLVLLLVLTSGCNWVQGWHWPRTPANGSSTTETLIYFQNDVVDWQGDYVQWAANVISYSPAVQVILVDTCWSGINCVVWNTWNVDPWGAFTTIYPDGSAHIIAATVTLHPYLGSYWGVTDSKQIVCHEGLHALGGGFEPSVHWLCDGTGWPTAHDYEEIARVYSHYD